MDTQTVAAYDTLAETFAREWREQPAPDDLYALLRRVFKAGGDTVDIGCGAGREVAWLNANGYPAVGYDASAGLLEAARTQYPGLSFRRAMLPELVGIAEGAFDNVVCETVIMHLPPAQIGAAVRRLLALLRPGGTLYLSWRVTPRPTSATARPALHCVRRRRRPRSAGRCAGPLRRGRRQPIVGQDPAPGRRAAAVTGRHRKD